ncbi:MAG TPA: helix-turn-helix domain-containing protein [Polyangiaceae bacterium]|jgi:transcriptional regulator with XRE-family HTH domain
MSALSSRLGQNVRVLRESRGLTQSQIAKLAGIPRATLAHVESGDGNPTLAILSAVADAFQVSLEELVAAPRGVLELIPKAKLAVRMRGNVEVRKLLPDPIPGMEIDRFALPPRAKMIGVPHTPGTREYLTCERGALVLVASGERVTLGEGDVVAFRGDQRHSYENPEATAAVGYSVVVLAR